MNELIKRDILLMAEPHVGKTTEVLRTAEYIYDNFGLTTRYINADLGSADLVESSGLVQKGVIDFLDLAPSGLPFAHVMNCFTKGFWFKRDANGEPDDIDATEAFRFTNKDSYGRKINGVGLYVFEGISSLGKRYLDYLKTDVKGKTAFNNSYKWTDGTSEIRGLDKGHYGMVQAELYKWIRNAKGLPAPYKIWTTHVSRDDDGMRVMIVPQGVGSADNRNIPAQFSTSLYMCLEEVTQLVKGEEKNVTARLAYYEGHFDDVRNAYAPATLRLWGEAGEAFKAKYPYGCFVCTPKKGIIHYLMEYQDILVNKKE